MNVIDLIKEHVTPDFVSKVSSSLGESDLHVSKAINAYIPVLLGSIFEKRHSVNGLFQTIKAFGASHSLNNLSLSDGLPDTVKELKNTLLGSNKESIVNKVADYAGISQKSSGKLLDVSSFLTFGSLGKAADDRQVSENDLFSLLGDAKKEIVALLPAGLGLSSFFSSTNTHQHNQSEVHHEKSHKEHEKGAGFWKWFIPLLIIVLAIIIFLKCCNKHKEGAVVVQETEIITDSVPNNTDTVASKKELSTIDLDGVALKGYANGLEEQIIKFIKSPEFKTDSEDQLKSKWFDFDNINFAFNRTNELEPGSEVQLDNLASILKKYPEAKIKIGAYTDKKGDEKVNKNISQKRADFLKAELTKRGVGNQVVSAEGYGDEFAKVSADASDEERAVDRKMSLRFTKE